MRKLILLVIAVLIALASLPVEAAPEDLLLAIPNPTPKNTPGCIYVVFRYDDYSNWTSTTLETQIIDLFAKYNVSCTFAIIPFSDTHNYTTPGPQNPTPLNAEKAEILKRAIESGTIEPAQHGYAHLPVSKGVNSEFRGLPYTVQMKKTSDGKKALEDSIGEKVRVFCPPWNSIDHTTLRVLDELGFDCLTADSRHAVADPQTRIQYVPATCEMLQLQDAVERARRNNADTNIIVVLFHQFDFLEIDAKQGRFTLQDVDALLAWTTKQNDLRVATFQEVISACDADAQMFLTHRRINRVKLLLPGRFWAADSLIYVAPVGFGGFAKAWAAVIACWGAVFLAALGLTVAVGKPLIRKMRFLLLMAQILFPLTLIAFCALHLAANWFNTQLFYLGITVLIAMNVGVRFLSIIPGKRKKVKVSLKSTLGI